ncbi:MAG: hypothetical protein JXA30_20575 [Deltaproteobacteria bacterium]|nr:hypothetical protein [Deltaproteobacteria bacterium]
MNPPVRIVRTTIGFKPPYRSGVRVTPATKKNRESMSLSFAALEVPFRKVVAKQPGNVAGNVAVLVRTLMVLK